jgi:galactokinase
MPETLCAFAPGRVNIVGEHTDYNEGLCLPFPIEAGVRAELRPGASAILEVEALDLGEADRIDLRRATEPATGWRAFVRGTVAELAAAGHALRGGTLRIGGNLPRGSGLSSSAAVEVALALVLLAGAGAPEPQDRRELARLCSRVENAWVGAQTGLLDQLAALLGRDGHAMRLDLRTLAAEHVPLELDGWRFATVESGVAHSHGAGSGYNARRQECRDACAALGLGSLRDATLAGAARLPEPLGRRVRHVVEENARVDTARAALQDGDLHTLAGVLDASHASLRDLYEVSVPEVETIVAQLKRSGAAGARIVGGGFGGSVLALLPPDVALPAGAVEVRPGGGARLL